MTDVLLTGAGFSKNWGGWLADEVFDYLLGCPEMNEDVRTAIWRAKNSNYGFEGTLQALRDTLEKYRDDRSADNLKLFEKMLFGRLDTTNFDSPSAEHAY